MIVKIVSGGQTGVDRAALEFALRRGIPCSGWCPKGRRAEDGVIESRFPLHETPSGSYSQRTRWNVLDSDGTLIIRRGILSGGTALTWKLALAEKRPCHMVILGQQYGVAAAQEWLIANAIQVLNIAGPRESENVGIFQETLQFLEQLFS